MSYDEVEEAWADRDDSFNDYFIQVKDSDMWMPIPKLEEE